MDTLTPPLMQVPNLHAYPDWRKQRVPDMLWLSARVDAHAGNWQASHRALDPSTTSSRAARPSGMDGRLSTFTLITEAARPAARRALRKPAPEALAGR